MRRSLTKRTQFLPGTLVLMGILLALMISSAIGKSVYIATDHHTAKFDAYGLNLDGTASFQASYTLQYSTDPSGIAIDAVTDTGNPVMFITSEFSAGVEILDPVNLTYLGVSTGPSDLAGIDVDDADDIVFTIGRQTNDLHIYQWEPAAQTLTQVALVNLPGMYVYGGFGIAFDDSRDILWVADYYYRMVRAYNMNVADWNDIAEIPELSFSVTHRPIDVTVDTHRNIAYTVAGWFGDLEMCKYDIDARIETVIPLGLYGGVGVAVDEVTGYVYLTRGPSGGDDLQVWDPNQAVPVLLQDTADLGNPAGLAIANVSYNPPNLAKNGIVQGEGVAIGELFTYEISFDSPEFDMTSILLTDDLPATLDFESANEGGVYDAGSHTVAWNLGDIAGGQPVPIIYLDVRVNTNAQPGETIYNYCTLESDQFGPITVIDDEDEEDPGQTVQDNITVGFDIHPKTCLTPFNPIRRGVIPAAILGGMDFDVTEIDAASVLVEGIIPTETWIEDVSRPGEGEDCPCSREGPDGYPDLVMKFNAEDLSAALGYSDTLSMVDDIKVVTVTGLLSSGTPIIGTDCLDIKGSTDEFELDFPEPNPFNPLTTVAYALGKTSTVKLNVVDLRGRVVATLVDGVVPAGEHQVLWKAERASSGVYFMCLTVEGKTKVQRAVLLK